MSCRRRSHYQPCTPQAHNILNMMLHLQYVGENHAYNAQALKQEKPPNVSAGTTHTRIQSCGAKSGFSGSSTVRTFLSAKLAFFPDGNLDACVVKLTLSPPEVISNCTYGCATACDVVWFKKRWFRRHGATWENRNKWETFLVKAREASGFAARLERRMNGAEP